MVILQIQSNLILKNFFRVENPNNDENVLCFQILLRPEDIFGVTGYLGLCRLSGSPHVSCPHVSDTAEELLLSPALGVLYLAPDQYASI